MKSTTVKGYLFALLATIAFSNVYIFSKAALNEVHLSQFGLYWFAIGATLSFLYAWKKKRIGQLKTFGRRQIIILISLGILEILTTTSFFISVHVIADPAVTSFLGNMFPVMVAFGGILILRERFGWIEMIGIALALTGAFIISYTGGSQLKDYFIEGTGWVFINALFAAVTTIVIKVQVKRITPEILNLNRSVWLLVFSFIMFMVYKQSFIIPISALKNIAVGAILGPFLAILIAYYSFQFIEVSRSSIIQSLKGIFVLFGAFFFFHTFPLAHQILGGIVTVIGVLLMALGQAGVFRKRK